MGGTIGKTGQSGVDAKIEANQLLSVQVDFTTSRCVGLRHLGKLPQLVDVRGVPVRGINQYLRTNCTVWSQNTIRTYANHLARLASWVEENNMEAVELTQDHLARYAHALAGRSSNRLKSSTCISALTVAQSYLKWNELAATETTPPFPSKPHARKLLRSANSRLGILDAPMIEPVKFALLIDARKFAQTMLSQEFSGIHAKRNELLARLMYESGLRVAEVASFKIEDLSNAVYDDSPSIASIIGKGQKRRFVSIPSALLRELHGYIDLERASLLENIRGNLKPAEVFLGQHGHPISTSYIQQLFREASTGLQRRITPHTLRHTYATYHYLVNRDIVQLQKLLGHADLTTTSKYIGTAALLDQSDEYQRLLQSLESGEGLCT